MTEIFQSKFTRTNYEPVHNIRIPWHSLVESLIVQVKPFVKLHSS